MVSFVITGYPLAKLGVVLSGVVKAVTFTGLRWPRLSTITLVI